MNGHAGPVSSREELRKRVVEVARKAFHARGIREVTMDEVAHALTMSKRTLYQLFADKEDLLIACAEEMNRRHREELTRLSLQTDCVLDLLLSDFKLRMQELECVTSDFFLDLARYPRAVRYMEEHRRENARLAVEFLNKGVRQGLLRPDVNLELLYDMLSSIFDTGKAEDYLGKYTPFEIFIHYVFVYFRGCTTPKGTAIMDTFLERYRQERQSAKR